MDRNLGIFSRLAIVSVAVLAAITAAFVLIYRYSSIDTYNYILRIIILLAIIFIMFFTAAILAVTYSYRRRQVKSGFAWMVRMAMKTLLPFVVFIAGLMRQDKDSIRKIYIDINNLMVSSMGKKYSPSEILVLLPHCLQNSQCSVKITNSIGSCKRCGRCCIGDISRLAEEMQFEARVVTGGTAARKAIGDRKPRTVLTVACERDLASGISDIGSIPVIGVLNERPNGPCFNTTVDFNTLKNKLFEIVKTEE